MSSEVFFPTSAEEAASLYGDGEGITVLAGGTILLPDITYGRVKPERTLMLERSGLEGIREEGGVVKIGAMTRLTALVNGPEPLLAQYASHIADNEVRANATVGGNICAQAGRDAQRGDLGAALIALGARVRSTGKGGERTEPVEDFLAADRSGRLVLELEYDKADRKTAATGMRRRHAHSYAIANVAVAERDGELRVGVAGVGGVARRARSVESSRNAGDVLGDVELADDAVASSEYRRQVLPLLVKQVLDQLENA